MMEKTRRRRSIIWNYFNKLAVDQAKCKICCNIYSYSSSSNLFRHLKSKHPHIIHQTDASEKSIDNSKDDNIKETGIWKYFNKIGSDMVKCEFCSHLFVFNRTSTPNLKKHIQRHMYRKSQSSALVKLDVNEQSTRKSRRNRSSVWKYFNREGPMQVRCKFCSNIYSFKSGSISNLSRHIALKHPCSKVDPMAIQCKVEDTIIECENEEEYQSTDCVSNIEITPTKKSSITLGKLITQENAELLNTLLLKFIVKQYHTFQIVEEREFREYVYHLNPDYTIPTATELSDVVLDKIYNSKVSEIKESLNSITSCSVSIDEWLSASNDNFISVTVHYINDSCELCSFFLDCFMCIENCTAENVAEGVNDICQTWEIDNKIVAVTSYKNNVIETVANILGWPHIPCFSHILITILCTSLEEIQSLQEKVDLIFDFLKKNLFAVMHLQSIQENTTCCEEILNLDISKKWNNTILMFETILRNKCFILTALNLLGHELLITDEEFNIIQQVTQILKPFLEAIQEMNLQKQVNISKIVVFTYGLAKFVDSYDEKVQVAEEIKSFLNRIKDEIKKLLSDVEKEVIFAEATLLDPRFKQPGFYNNELYNNTKNAINKKVQNTGYHPPDTAKKHLEKHKISSFWDDFDSAFEKDAEKSFLTAGKLELDRYTEEMLLSRKENPLKWWKLKEIYYPNLYPLMKKTLCVVGSTVSHESLYIFTERIKSSTKLPKLLFLHSNL